MASSATREALSAVLDKLQSARTDVGTYAQEAHFNILTSDKMFNEAEFESKNSKKLEHEEAMQ
jgi:hypothetical protein